MENKKKLTVALAGNPNSGKSTIFNHLTGARQHIGNYPGVTVEKKEGFAVYRDYEIIFVDLPGTYSLSAHSEDEKVARDFILNEKPDIVVNIVDSTTLERSLYLFTQLYELKIPILLALNMADMLEQKKQKIDTEELSRLLKVPVVMLVGNKNIGIDHLKENLLTLHEERTKREYSKIDYGFEISEECEKIELLLKRLKNNSDITRHPSSWIALKLLENDSLILEEFKQIPLGNEVIKTVQNSRNHLNAHFSEEPEMIIAEKRYGFISGIITQVLTLPEISRQDLSEKIDRFVLHRFLGLPVFALVMYGIFLFTFSCSEPFVGWLESFMEYLSGAVSKMIPEGLIQSFVVDGVIGGVGGVLGFFPLVLFMFFAIAFFEDSGYMARAAFVMDKLMSRFGLHGKSFLPLMIATNGCAVPGIMASRTLDSKKDRLITMMVTPFMICGAKLPIFALFIGAFFPAEQGPSLMMLMYTLSVVLALGSAYVLKKTVLKGEPAHFVMELPAYRVPTLKGLLLKMWERGWLYLKKAGSIILLISVIIWAGFTFPQMEQKGNEASEEQTATLQMEQSYAGRLGKMIEPVVSPLGLDWKSGIAFLAGIAAKEVVVSTLGTIYSMGEVDPDEADPLKEAMAKDPAWNKLKVFSFLMFSLIYLPCFVAMAVFYRESGSSLKWTAFLIFWTTVMAWGASFITYQGGKLLGLGG